MNGNDLLSELDEVLGRDGVALAGPDRDALLAFARLLALDTARASVGELIEGVVDHQSVAAVLSGVGAAALAAWDGSLAWVDDGSRSAASWLQGNTPVSRGRAGSELKMARGLRETPIVAAHS